MPWITSAVLIGGTLLGGAMSSHASNKAADAQKEGNQQAIDESRHEFNVAQQNMAPYREAGNKALDAMMSLTGLAAPQTSQSKPDYPTYPNNPAHPAHPTNPAYPIDDPNSPLGHLPAYKQEQIRRYGGMYNQPGNDNLPPGVRIQPFARGGTLRAGGLGLVGEREPEWIRDRAGGTSIVTQPTIIQPTRDVQITPASHLPTTTQQRLAGVLHGSPGNSAMPSGLPAYKMDQIMRYRGDPHPDQLGANMRPAPRPGPGPMPPPAPRPAPAPKPAPAPAPQPTPDPAPGGGAGGAVTYTRDPETGEYTPVENPGGVAGGYNFKTDPGYNFRFNEGERAIEDSAAAKGGLLSGGLAKALTKYGQNFASNEYQNVYNRIAQIAGMGQNAAAGIGNAAMQTGGRIGQYLQASGTAAANNAINQGNIWGNAINSGIGMYGLYKGGAFGG